MDTSRKLTLLSAAAATGSSTPIIAPGKHNWSVYGTWDSASAQLQWSPNGGTTWIDIDGAVLTANGGWSDIPIAGGHVRVSISGAGGSTSLTSDLRGVD